MCMWPVFALKDNLYSWGESIHNKIKTCLCFLKASLNFKNDFFFSNSLLLYTNIDQTLVNSLHRLLNCEIGGLDCHVIATEYITHVHCIHM